jgi:hypothetical protein
MKIKFSLTESSGPGIKWDSERGEYVHILTDENGEEVTDMENPVVEMDDPRHPNYKPERESTNEMSVAGIAAVDGTSQGPFKLVRSKKKKK